MGWITTRQGGTTAPGDVPEPGERTVWRLNLAGTPRPVVHDTRCDDRAWSAERVNDCHPDCAVRQWDGQNPSSRSQSEPGPWPAPSDADLRKQAWLAARNPGYHW